MRVGKFTWVCRADIVLWNPDFLFIREFPEKNDSFFLFIRDGS